MKLEHGQYFDVDKLRGEPDWERVKAIMIDNGASLPTNADNIWRHTRKIAFTSSWLRTRMRFVRGDEWFAPDPVEVELPRSEPADPGNVDTEAMIGLLLQMQAENDAIRGKLFDYVNAQDGHIDQMQALMSEAGAGSAGK